MSDHQFFDLTRFINDRKIAQNGFAKAAGQPELDDLTKDERYAKIIEYIGHAIEEVIEARMLVKRRSWKVGEKGFLDDPQMRKEFLLEMADIQFFLAAIYGYAGVSGEEATAALCEKIDINSKRKDHKTNTIL